MTFCFLSCSFSYWRFVKELWDTAAVLFTPIFYKTWPQNTLNNLSKSFPILIQVIWLWSILYTGSFHSSSGMKLETHTHRWKMLTHKYTHTSQWHPSICWHLCLCAGLSLAVCEIMHGLQSTATFSLSFSRVAWQWGPALSQQPAQHFKTSSFPQTWIHHSEDGTC